MTPARSTSLIATIAVLIGLSDLPYGYYVLLRLFLFVVSLFLAFGASLALDSWHRWMLGGFAILYIPLFPIYLREKGLWILANNARVLLFWAISARRLPVRS